MATTLLSVEDCRAERAEQRLHEATRLLSTIAMQAMNVPARSSAIEVLVDGKSILRLNNPINFDREGRAQPKAAGIAPHEKAHTLPTPPGGYPPYFSKGLRDRYA